MNRPSQDLDVATENPAPMADIAATPRAGLASSACKVDAPKTAPLSARFTVTDPATGEECEVDALKEIFWRPVAQSPYGPALSEEDVIRTNIRALADREAPGDLIDAFAASRRWSNAEIEEFGRRHARGRFEREDLQANLMGAEWPTPKPSPRTGSTTPPSQPCALGPWSGPTTLRPASSKRPMIRASADRSRMRSHL